METMSKKQFEAWMKKHEKEVQEVIHKRNLAKGKPAVDAFLNVLKDDESLYDHLSGYTAEHGRIIAKHLLGKVDELIENSKEDIAAYESNKADRKSVRKVAKKDGISSEKPVVDVAKPIEQKVQTLEMSDVPKSEPKPVQKVEQKPSAPVTLSPGNPVSQGARQMLPKPNGGFIGSVPHTVPQTPSGGNVGFNPGMQR